MKKIIGLSMVGLTLLLASCGKNEQTTSSETSQSMVQTSETTAMTTSETTTRDSKTTTGVKEANTTVTTTQASSTDQNTKTSATTVPDSTTNVSSEPAFTPEQKQALDAIYAKYPEYKDSDIAFIFWQMIGDDYLFKAYSLSMSEQGGSGTLTFFRVSPTGEVQETDPSGNPY
ncbi:hypothetical protein [Candidatus Enterococcus courvalinii]|uniref:Lipoprotein n=1 Tax=Candidatus Enterococcus courvalinii TaxID=2815329 RepID=A0ABS3I2M6_9ENTE|nr:hypothetical protein [Enterococcus sp. MSG2901]MBO0482954.1 hypothetical protein [Enterococcus sp. MSG2901]